MHQLAIKDSFWLLFVQNPRARFSPKKSFWVNSKPLCCCTSWKYQKTHALNFNNTCKPLFRSILDPFGTIRSQKSYFQKKIFINLHLYTAVSNFKQKIRSSKVSLTFDDTWKSTFQPIWDPFWSKNINVFPKKTHLHHFWVYMLLQLQVKIHKSSIHWLLIIPENLLI